MQGAKLKKCDDSPKILDLLYLNRQRATQTVNLNPEQG